MDKECYKEINAERINIIDKSGKIKMAIFNQEAIPDVVIDNEAILPGHRKDSFMSGVVFYNGEGDECGGLLFGSKSTGNGGYESELSLTFDQYKQDQLVQMLVSEKDSERSYGFKIFDRPDFTLKEFIGKSQNIHLMDEGPEKQKASRELSQDNCQRIFIGKKQNGDVAVCVNDRNGNERIRLLVDSDNNPRIEFLDEQGDIIHSLPPIIKQ